MSEIQIKNKVTLLDKCADEILALADKHSIHPEFTDEQLKAYLINVYDLNKEEISLFFEYYTELVD